MLAVRVIHLVMFGVAASHDDEELRSGLLRLAPSLLIGPVLIAVAAAFPSPYRELLGFHGWLLGYVGLFAGFLLGAGTAVALLVARRVTRKTALPFGPALIVGALAVLAAAAGGALG